MKNLKQLFTGKLAFRIWYMTVLPVIMVFIAAGIAIGIYFSRFFLQDAVDFANRNTHAVADAFGDSYRDLVLRMVLLTASSDFQEQAEAIVYCLPQDYTTVRNNAQSYLRDYTNMNGLLQTTMILRTGRTDRQPMLFAPYSSVLINSAAEFGARYDASAAQGVTLLPVTGSPLANRDQVLPLVVPLRLESGVLNICAGENADMILYLLLDAATLDRYLHLYSTDSVTGTLYLASPEGAGISLPESEAVYQTLAGQPEYSSRLHEAIENGEEWFHYGANYIYCSGIGYGGLHVVNIISDSDMLAGINDIRSLFTAMLLTSVVVITMACLLISLLVTHPLRSLMGTVHAIENGRYDGQLRLRTADELGQLERALDTMHSTIIRQIEVIEREQQEKYDARMQMLTEQINPHFLYNTLEFINMEVYNRHPQNASRMISNLGNYIRICLSSGDTEIEIGRELGHVLNYVDIMSFRFAQPIEVTVEVPEELRPCKIVKCILQPLVENSLKHGFKTGSGQMVPIPPRVNIAMELTETELRIAITDNGEGIDIERANQIMRSKQGKNGDKHLGLNNIYARLNSRYGHAEMEFTSVPYFENKVLLRLPAGAFRSQIEAFEQTEP